MKWWLVAFNMIVHKFDCFGETAETVAIGSSRWHSCTTIWFWHVWKCVGQGWIWQEKHVENLRSGSWITSSHLFFSKRRCNTCITCRLRTSPTQFVYTVIALHLFQLAAAMVWYFKIPYRNATWFYLNLLFNCCFGLSYLWQIQSWTWKHGIRKFLR